MTTLVARAAAVAMIVIASAGAAGSIDQPPAPPAPNPLIEQLIAAQTDDARAAFYAAHEPALTTELLRAVTVRGLELRRTSRLDEAGRAFIAAKQIAQRLGDQLRVANSLINYASIPGQQGDYPAALAAANEAVAIARGLHDDELLGAALATLGIIKKLVGDLDGALETYRQSLALAQAAGRRDTEARILTNMALARSMQGHYRDALERYQQSLAIKEQIGTAPDDIALTLNNMGTLYETQGNDWLALEYYKRALRLTEARGGDGATELSNIAHVNANAGRLTEALDGFQQVLAIYEKNGNRAGLATTVFNIAGLRRDAGRLEEALEGYRKSLEIREALNDRVGLAESYVDLAMTLGDLRRYDEAIAAADRARSIASAIKADDRLWEPQAVLGRLHQALHHGAEAERAYRDAIETIERLRAEVAGGSESREQFLEQRLTPYRGLTTVLIEAGRTADALQVAERAHGRVLAEALEAGDSTARPLTDAERGRQRQLEQDVVSRTAQLDALRRRPSPDRVAVADATERLRLARLTHDEFRDALDARYPVRRLARGAVDDLMPALAGIVGDERVAVVEYVIGGEGLHVLVATKGGDEDGAPRIQAFALPGTKAALVARVNGFRAKLAARAPDFHADARALYDTLLAPARAAIAGRTRLVIVPDDVLWYVPFEALEPATGRAVVDTASVAYVPSVGVLRAMRQRRAALTSRPAAPRLLVAANPVSDLPKLPEAEVQARDLAAIYGAGQTRSYVAAAATEARVRSAAAGATVIHFATHGVIDDVSPMYSFLQLTRGGRNEAENDGRLEAWEIQSLKLDALVAVLTACDTGRGRLSGGEGVIGLAWAFFAAGTPSTIVSLWELESASATMLTLALHRRLRASLVKGRSAAAENLRAAALELRRDPRFRHPFYWAGLVAVGDGY